MEKNPWAKLNVLYVIGITIEQAAEVVALRTNVGGKTRERIHNAVDGVLVQVRDTDPDAGEVVGCLVARFGQNRVVDASQTKPGELLSLRMKER